MTDWTPEHLHSLSREALAEQLLRETAATNRTIHRFTLDQGTCYRAGTYTSPPEDRHLNAAITTAIDLLVEHDLLAETSNDKYELTDDGHTAAAAAVMHPQSVAILDLLLRAGLCSPKLWEGSFNTLPPLERDETLDALSQGALPLSQVIWEWAGTYGHINPLHATSFDADLTEFYEALTNLATHFTVQLSVPSEDTGLQVMPPFPEQRVHLVNRTEWFNLTTPDEEDEIPEDITIPEDLPALTDPAMHLGEHRVGETWVRVAPEELAELREKPLELLGLLRSVADTRIEQLRTKLRQMTFTEEQAAPLQAQLNGITSWQRMLHGGINALEQLPPDKQVEKAPGILTILTTMEAPPDATRPGAKKPGNPPPDDLKKAALGIVWNLPRPLRYAIVGLVLLTMMVFTIWTTLPDTTKERVIENVIKADH